MPEPTRCPAGRWRARLGRPRPPWAWSLVAFGPQTPFPGPAALVPVAGTGAALVAGTRCMRAGPARLLGLAPMQPIGTVSYTWYLWHWPALILAPYVVGHRARLAQNVGVGLFSLLLAALTTVLLEQPVRRSRWLSAARRAASSSAARSASAPRHGGRGGRRRCRHRWAAVTPPPHDCRRPGPPPPATSATVPPAVATADALDAQVNRQVYESLANPQVPANLTPSLADAAADVPAP